MGGSARELPDVIAAADDALALLRAGSYKVQGYLRSTQSQPDEALQGIITTDLILDIKLLGAGGDVRETFTVSSRGGGFTSESSALQARERLRAALQERLKAK